MRRFIVFTTLFFIFYTINESLSQSLFKGGLMYMDDSKLIQIVFEVIHSIIYASYIMMLYGSHIVRWTTQRF